MKTRALKHEWLRTRALLGTIIAAAPLLGGLGTLLTATGWPIISLFGITLAMIAIGGLIPALHLALAFAYWQSSYGKTGYFTQSLPIRGATIYSVKLLWASIVTILGLVVSLGLGLLFWPVLADQVGAERNPFTVLRSLFNLLSEFGSPLTLVLAGLLLLAFVLIWPIHYFFAASIGSETPLNRLGFGGPVLVFVGLYLATQVGSFVGLFAIPWGLTMTDGSFELVPFHLINEMDIGVGVSNTTETMPIGMLPVIIVITLVCWWRTRVSWNRKISLI